ncbi:hypothetical protein SUGI_0674220 [Cryptomeria japonica]|nr:hypothetical protein SUGI_0674220 [Cryptomeria japonica]
MKGKGRGADGVRGRPNKGGRGADGARGKVKKGGREADGVRGKVKKGGREGGACKRRRLFCTSVADTQALNSIAKKTVANTKQGRRENIFTANKRN